MNAVVSLLNEIGGWLTSAGLLSIFLALVYREWSERRTRVKERKAIVFLLVEEIRSNDSNLQSMVDTPANITHGPHKDLRFKVWEDTRLRLAQLLRNNEQFQNILSFYSFLAFIQDIINSPVISNEDKQSLVSLNIEVTREAAQEAISILGQYVKLPEPGYTVSITIPIRD